MKWLAISGRILTFLAFNQQLLAQVAYNGLWENYARNFCTPESVTITPVSPPETYLGNYIFGSNAETVAACGANISGSVVEANITCDYKSRKYPCHDNLGYLISTPSLWYDVLPSLLKPTPTPIFPTNSLWYYLDSETPDGVQNNLVFKVDGTESGSENEYFTDISGTWVFDGGEEGESAEWGLCCIPQSIQITQVGTSLQLEVMMNFSTTMNNTQGCPVNTEQTYTMMLDNFAEGDNEWGSGNMLVMGNYGLAFSALNQKTMSVYEVIANGDEEVYRACTWNMALQQSYIMG